MEYEPHVIDKVIQGALQHRRDRVVMRFAELRKKGGVFRNSEQWEQGVMSKVLSHPCCHSCSKLNLQLSSSAPGIVVEAHISPVWLSTYPYDWNGGDRQPRTESTVIATPRPSPCRVLHAPWVSIQEKLA